MCNDEQFTREYHGLNSLFLSSTIEQESNKPQVNRPSSIMSGNHGNPVEGAFTEFYELFKKAISMGDMLQKLMLEKVV
jgi:hypothetical protein